MRRQNAISVRVRMPSRGLVTRLPSESADRFRSTDTQHVSVVAQNVRYEDGVVAAAPGYEQVTLTPSISSPFQRFHQGNLLDDAWLTALDIHTDQLTPLVGMTADKIYWFDRSFSGGFQAGLTQLFSGTAADKGAPWFAEDFFNKILFAQRNNNPQYWVSGDPTTRPLPGLPTNDALWDGVSSFFGHVILWRGDRFKWSDKNDFTNYIPVGTTAASVHLTTAADFVQPAAGSNVTVNTNEDPTGLVVGQFVSIATTAPAYNFYIVEDTFLGGSELTGAVVHSGGGGTGYVVGDILTVAGGTIAADGVASTVQVSSVSGGVITGVTILTAGKYSTPPTTTANAVPGGTGTGATLDLTFTVLPNTVTLQLQDLTGATTPGTTITAGSDIFTLDANEAGETPIAGAGANGPIFQFMQVGDYGFILKERSITSAQYVGLGSGIFYLHTEFTGEGLLSTNAAVNLGDGRIVFLGHRELYQYSGGPTPTPVCQQVTRQLYSELDRSRLDEIILYHNESRKEVWVYYPITGGNKTLIWNYYEDTATFDDVPAGLSGITALAAVDWPSDFPWFALADDSTWANFDPTFTWEDFSTGSRERVTLFGSGDNLARIHGLQYTRDGAAYTSLNESMDYDFGDPDLFKYVDVVVFALQVNQPSDSTKQLFVQVGTKNSLDQDLRWSVPLTVDVKGNSTPPIKVNPGGSGRFIRLRIYSQDADVQWRISSFEIHCRPGGFY